jgi:hypothetical protein
VAPDHPFQYIIFRSYQHVQAERDLGVSTYCTLGLMCRKTAIEVQLPLARDTQLVRSLLR